jgi:hypothetical protein
MNRLAITTLLLALLLALPAQADEQTQANRLFVEVTKLVEQARTTQDLHKRAQSYGDALERLESIIERYPGSNVAVQMATGQQIGTIGLPLIRAAAQLARLQRDQDAERLSEIEARLEETVAYNRRLEAENAKLGDRLTKQRNKVAALRRDRNTLRAELQAQASAPSAQTEATQAQLAEIQSENREVRRLLWDERARSKDLQTEVTGLQSLLDSQTAPSATSVITATSQPTTSAAQNQVALAPTKAPTKTAEAPLTAGDITGGVREALKVGTERVVAQLGQADGFNADPKIHIPLPDTLREVRGALNMIGMSAMADDVETKLNRAAEAATPKAKALFWKAITDMSLEDIEGIYNGPDDAATQYFRSSMSAPLRDEMRPVVDSSLADVGAIQAFDQMMGRYKTIPFVPNVKADLSNHVLDKAMDGIFYYLGREEAAIRNDAVKRTTEILKLVFGST